MPTARKAGHRRRRADVDIGRPDVERNRRDLEEETHRQATSSPGAGAGHPVRRQTLGQVSQPHCAGHAVDQRDLRRAGCRSRRLPG